MFRENKKIGSKAVTPSLIQITAYLIVVLVPFTNLWLKAYFSFYKNQREEIVQKVF